MTKNGSYPICGDEYIYPRRFKRRKMTKKKPTLIEHFKDIIDPRLKRKQLHKLDDMFFITLVYSATHNKLVVFSTMN
jgi:hypothetical protein